MTLSASNTIPGDVLAGWTVLVIDDDPDALEVATMLLSLYGANVVTATNGLEGLAAIKKHKPRFVVVDLSMPEMTGWEMVANMKNDRTILDIPVVALTAHAMAGDRNRALALGFHNYLTKPLLPETFVNDLLKLLAVDIPELAVALERGSAKS
jgi:CheY-like chemotaxis protein